MTNTATEIALTDDLIVWQLGGFVETRTVHLEVFERDVYLKHGVRLPDTGGVVVDVGANIGLFMVRCVRERQLKVLCCEPMPLTAAVLQQNAERFAGVSTVLIEPVAVGATRSQTGFRFFPHATVMSTNRPDEQRQLEPHLVEVLATAGWNRFRDRFPLFGWLLAPVRRPLLRFVVRRRLRRAVDVNVEVWPLSDLMERHGLTHIDLLKIDVEGGELDVLLGVRHAHWPHIHQVAVEVQNIDGRTRTVRELLEQHGFAVTVDPDEQVPVAMVYACRKLG